MLQTLTLNFVPPQCAPAVISDRQIFMPWVKLIYCGLTWILCNVKSFWRFTVCNRYLKIGFQRWKIHSIDFMSSGFQYISTDWGRCAVIKWRDPPDWKMTQIWTLWCTCQGDLEGGCARNTCWYFLEDNIDQKKDTKRKVTEWKFTFKS